ncbi:hypothetical protein AAGS61_15410 [Lysinibacillus sp. KU-BSD001]|uniref:hypothetical protein n=1 Tax=Lysinibacillus sp. KU-BSD001 TaxID=3141328 RepID=UPI0036ED06A6
MKTYLSYDEILPFLGNLSSEKYIDTTQLNRVDLEKLLSTSILDVTNKARSDEIEKFLNPPSFVAIFYYYIYVFQKVPTQQQYRDFYYEINSEWIGQNVKEKLLPAFEGRVARTYPSLFRDIHFYFFLKETGSFNRVIYKMKYDLSGKVDIFIQTKRNNWFGIQLRLDTKNSNYFAKERKPHRDVVDIPVLKAIIDLPLKLSNARSIKTQKNDLKVYSNNEYMELLNLIRKYE